METQKLRATVMLVMAAVVYGALFPCNKIAALAGIPPAGYAFWQSFGAGVILWAAAALRGNLPAWSWPHLRAYLAVGALAISLPMALLTYVAPHLPAGIVTLVLALSPPLTYLLGILAGTDRFRLFGMFGIGFGLAGVALLVGPTGALSNTGMAGWFLLSLLAPVMFASCNVLAALLRPPATTSTAFGSGILFGAALVVFPVMLLMGQVYVPGIGRGDAALGVAIVINSAFVVLFLEIIRIAGPTFFAQFNYLAVLAGIGWGAALFGEALGLGIWFALLLMAIGVVLTGLKDRRRAVAGPESRGAVEEGGDVADSAPRRG